MNAPALNIAAAVTPALVPDLFPYNAKPSAKHATAAEYLAAARALVPLLRENAAKTAEQRRPVDEVVSAIVEAGIANALRPQRYGGGGLELSEVVAIGSVLGEGCSSTAWDYIVWEVHNWLAGMLPEAGQEEMFGAHDVAIVSGVANVAKAKARAVDGGYMISGRWAFGSGSTHSNWVLLFAAIDGVEVDGRPEVRMMGVPRSAYVIEDTWKVTGLSGTGSHDIVIKDEVFVPAHRTATRADIAGGTTPGAKLHPETASYGIPLPPGAHLATASSAIGLAKAMIAHFIETTKKRTYVTGKAMVDVPASAIRIATALVEVEAAEALLQNTLKELEAEVRAGRKLTLELRAKARMIAGYVPDLCKQVVHSVVAASGASGLLDGSPTARALMDVNMMSVHQSTEYDRGPENYGRVVLGLEPSNIAI